MYFNLHQQQRKTRNGNNMESLTLQADESITERAYFQRAYKQGGQYNRDFTVFS